MRLSAPLQATFCLRCKNIRQSEKNGAEEKRTLCSVLILPFFRVKRLFLKLKSSSVLSAVEYLAFCAPEEDGCLRRSEGAGGRRTAQEVMFSSGGQCS